jgi:hypothetical protein
VHSGHRVRVEVSLLFDDLRFSLGEWINVIGYLENEESGESWIVKAIMVWNVTPGFNLIQYENVIKSRMEAII